MLPFVSASGIYDLATAELYLQVDSDIRLSGSIDSVEANLSFIPNDDYRQEVSVDYGLGQDHGDYVVYSWKNPDDVLEYGYTSTIKTSAEFADVRARVPFPIKNIPEDIEKYLSCTEKIDCDSQSIISRASELASGKDDLFDVVFTFATYSTDTLEYDLTFSDDVECASDVLEIKRGVCTEFTTLMIAFCRAVGIPARYISGEAYSNQEGIKGFGEHAWAEVFFPGYGWVPFDPTYAEYGMVDASHIALKKSVDADQPASSFVWFGRDGNLVPGELDITAEIIKEGDDIEPFVKIKTELTSELAIGSYGLITVDITNLLNKYVATTVDLSKIDELTVEDPERHVYLSPFETKTIQWIFKIDDDMAENMIYDFPIFIYTKQLINESVKVKARREYTYYTRNEILDMMVGTDDDASRKEMVFDCSTEPEQLSGTVEVVCGVENKGNTDLKDLEICGFGECRVVDVPITHRKVEKFTKEFLEEGRFELNFTAGTDTEYLNIKIIDQPRIEILNVTAPDTASPEDTFEVSFVLDRVSGSFPSNVRFYLIHKNIKKEWSTQIMTSETLRISEKVSGGVLSLEDNQFMVKVVYEDVEGNKHCDDETFLVNLRDASLFQKVKIFIFDMFSTDKNELSVESCKR